MTEPRRRLLSYAAICLYGGSAGALTVQLEHGMFWRAGLSFACMLVSAQCLRIFDKPRIKVKWKPAPYIYYVPVYVPDRPLGPYYEPYGEAWNKRIQIDALD